MPPSRTLRLAAVQMNSQPGRVADNLQKASRFVATAAERGASIVLFPELMPSGYRLTREMWSTAEGLEGPTTQWLQSQSSAHHIMIGTSYVEARGEDFHETFALCDERGRIVMRVRKSTPAAVEAFFIRGAEDLHTVETSFGRVGVALGYESLHASVLRSLNDADLVLLPHCAPTPNVSRAFGSRDAALFEEGIRDLAHKVASELGVPTVMANASGPWITPMPLFPDAHSRFPGLSSISDSDGAMCAQLDADEDVLTADVTLDPSRRRTLSRARIGRWAREVPWFVNAWVASEQLGRAAYALSGSRRRAALAISRGR